MSSGPNLLIRLFWRVHPKLYQWSGGRIGSSLMGLPVLLLTTTGRKSGLLRTKALMYLPYDGDFVVIASNIGQDHHPMWWLNLEARPEAMVQVKDRQFRVHVREAEGEERDKIWRALTTAAPSYDDYKEKTERHIPVVVLQRHDDQQQ